MDKPFGRADKAKWQTIDSRQTWPRIHRAVVAGDYEVVRLLLDQGEDPNRRLRPDIVRKTPLHLACQYRHRRIARLLIDRGADVNALDVTDEAPIHDAIRHRDIHMVRLLLDHGADVNVPGCWTWTPVGSVLNAAIAQGFLDIARLLINRGAIITVQTVEYTMSMQVRGAGRSSQEEMMALLRERAPEAVMEYWVEQDGGLQGGPRE